MLDLRPLKLNPVTLEAVMPPCIFVYWCFMFSLTWVLCLLMKLLWNYINYLSYMYVSTLMVLHRKKKHIILYHVCLEVCSVPYSTTVLITSKKYVSIFILYFECLKICSISYFLLLIMIFWRIVSEWPRVCILKHWAVILIKL